MSPRRNRYQIDDPRNRREGDEEWVSRSQRKRNSTALQVLGEQLAALPAADRADLPLTADLRAALEEYHRLPGREARRRQLQYIGRLMREAQDEGALEPLLDALGRVR